MMNVPSGDNNFKDFQILITNYESALHEITSGLDDVQDEQKAIRDLLKENKQLSAQLNAVLAKKTHHEIEYKFQDQEFIDNLKMQLTIALKEKEQAIELWQNATENVYHLEDELKVFQTNTQGLIPKAKMIELNKMYEIKLKNLETTLSRTKKQLEQTINSASKELKIKDKEIVGSLESHDNTFKIVKNLEDEVLNLQERLNDANKHKNLIEKKSKIKEDEIDKLKSKTKECRTKVEEALQVVEAALNEKDAALIREAEAKQEILRLSKSLDELIKASEEKIKTEINMTKANYNATVEKLEIGLKAKEEKIKMRNLEMENVLKKCKLLEQEVSRYREPTRQYSDKETHFLALEKNLENTFQKLLLSEKQNIQLRSEKESIKSDLDQMAQHYERDIKSREVEKVTFKAQIKKLKTELDETYLRLTTSHQNETELKEQVATIGSKLKKELEQAQRSLEVKTLELEQFVSEHDQFVQELHDQLKSQVAINKRWRVETKNITTKLEQRIHEFKTELTKIKSENKMLAEKLKNSNGKMFEYRQFLQTISKDVNKISTISSHSWANESIK